ncbi:conserved hypothetical protein [Dickeya chrysanthemi Ech1591]|uniref:Uncharacterized protein n=1 Tax=Dickeya chrysanthemi (strain Ech1591) TaxID=561229 RepID=C6CJM1_DICC1|nr:MULTISPECIES: MbeD/MobD family mobilization/exclusion protein [Dickeya]ACT08316.1 conserved hypothetical protein [Dickeya chrysanthemi Ech1591]TYL42330.1 hypothetical protein FDP13_13380 [Dickeya sp. ws52]WJM84390.1 MbeD/MobD family mobilization/exclusion protein [Dickeya chrysanthemi]
MCIEELEARLESALQALEASVSRQQQIWQRDYQHLHLQLVQARQREADLCSKINELVTRVNMMDESPERNPLLQKINLIRAHLDALAQEASAFHRSLL